MHSLVFGSFKYQFIWAKMDELGKMTPKYLRFLSQCALAQIDSQRTDGEATNLDNELYGAA